jgi:hypothetical protein
MLARILTGARVFAAWLVASAGALIILAVGRELYMAFMLATLQINRWSVQLVNIVYYTIAGMVWLGFFIFLDAYFSQGASKGLLLKRSLRIVGLELLILFLLQLALFGYGYLRPNLLTVSLTTGEGVLAAGMLFVVYKRLKTK